MRPAFIIIFFLLSMHLFAQSIQELDQQVVQLYKSGEYKKAIPYAEKDVILTGQTFGENDTRYVKLLNFLVLIYIRAGEYEKAEPAAIRSKELWKKLEGETGLDYIASMNILGTLYSRMAQYEKAEMILLQVKDAEKKARGENSLYYATILDYMGQLYTDMSRFEKAEPLLLQAKDIRMKISGNKQSGYVGTLNQLAYMYRGMHEYEKAINLSLEAREINRQLLGENHPEYIRSLVTLGLLYADYRQPARAEPILLQALQSIKSVAGEENNDYAATLNALGHLYIISGQAEKAEPLSLQAVNITRKILGENHPLYAKGLNNLGVIYKILKQDKKAESYYLQSKELIKKLWGEDHPEYESTLSNMAIFYSSIGEYEKAIPILIAANNINVKQIINTFTVLSEKEKSAFLQKNIFPFDFANSVLSQLKNNSPELTRQNFNQLLILKSVALSDSRNLLESIGKSNDPEVNKIFNTWTENKRILSRQYALPVINRRQDLDNLAAQTESLEKELNRRSSAFRDQQFALQISIQDVQKKLKKDEAAVEFVRFQLYNKDWKDSMIYAAYVLRKDDNAPQFIPLCEERELQKLFTSAGKNTSTMVSNFYRGATENSNAYTPGDSLYKLIWQPMEPYLKNIHSVSYSPAGLLFTVAFNALPYETGKLLMDKYRLQQLTSTRQIALRMEDKNSVLKSIALFGDARFTMDSSELVTQKNISGRQSVNNYSFSNRGGNNTSWSKLPGTADEVKKIQQLFLQNRINSRVYTQSMASEENLKALSGKSQQVIHIATHGFFLPEPDKKRNRDDQLKPNTFMLSDDPLLRSGLILSGANYAWGGKVLPEGIEDGICTAYEISQLDLGNTDLVVLSACETALGDIKGSEGVFGLQRGFKMAGAKKMIVSLWQVPDKETAELMTLFYSNWLHGKSIGESFYQAQEDMRKKYHPFYWAAFVLVE